MKNKYHIVIGKIYKTLQRYNYEGNLNKTKQPKQTGVFLTNTGQYGIIFWKNSIQSVI